MTAERRLIHRVEEVADRLQLRRRLTLQFRAWSLLTLVGLALLAANGLSATPLMTPAMTALTGLGLVVLGVLFSLRARASVTEAAQAVEEHYPDLDARLVTAVIQRPDMDRGGFSFLQHEVISETLLHAQRHNWRETVSTRSMIGAKTKRLISLVALVSVCLAAAAASSRSTVRIAEAPAADDEAIDTVDGYGLVVEPGDTMLERGTSLLVLARFRDQLPSTVTLVADEADGTRNEIPLSKSLDDPLFGGRVAQVETDLTYHVRFDDRQSETFRVKVFDYPRLIQADATIAYPEYTGLAQKQIEDVRRVSVVEGSTLTLTCTLNKSVADARLVSDERDDLVLAADADHPHVVSVAWQPEERRTFTLDLTDEAGRRNKQPPKFVVDVIPNQAPELKVAFPSRDIRVSPIQELNLHAAAWDDFGLKEVGLIYQLPDGQEQTLKLGDEAAAETKVDLSHELSFETMQAEPNELVAYYFYADDVGPDGNPRRAMSNMYFAEVRHFDEIYRQAQQSGQGQGQQQGEGQQGGPAQQLLKLQREIVIANWNLIRRETGKPSDKLSEDAGVIADSQREALALADEAKGAVEDLLSQQYLAAAVEHMQEAARFLGRAAETSVVEPLNEAGVSAQSAYRALLKLQARENLVQQSQSSQSSSSQGGQQQQLNQQLQQLELKNDRNRYESEQQDSAPANREALQALNRLRELARRQGDLNEKIKELENELRAAETEEERDEIERQLKRLQEEQQQLLRDLDELNERMERPENRSEMAEARQQLEETRDRLRETKEQLQKGQLSQALTTGTRAQRELEDLKEDFRNQTANQFADTMRDLREDVRELAEREQEIGDRLAGNEPPADDSERRRPQLRDEEPEGPDLQEAFKEQREKLADVMQEAEEIVRESEFSEPLLSKRLYDAIRDTRVDQPEQSLTMTSQFLRLGLDREAVRAEEQARSGIDKLRKGVEKAAESVLGNEAASLERAQKEIDDLAEAIASELAQADPEFADEQERRRQGQASGQSQQESREDRSGQAGGRPGDRRNESEESDQQQSGGSPRENDQQSPEQQSGRQPSEQQSGQQGQQGQQSENQQQGQQSESDSQQSGQQGQGQSQQQQSSQQQGQGQQGQGQQGQQPTDSDQPGQQGGSSQQQQTGRSSNPPSQGGNQPGRDDRLNTLLNLGQQDGGGASGPHRGPRRPLTSGEFKQWSERMRDVEEMLDDPDLRADVARIRDQAREMRIDVTRHSKQPDWDLVRLKVYGPMLELQDRIAEELARLRPDDEQIVPLDRDPVPDRYSELVRRYYERLGAAGDSSSDVERTPGPAGF